MTRVTGPYISNGESDAIFRTLREKYDRQNQLTIREIIL